MATQIRNRLGDVPNIRRKSTKLFVIDRTGSTAMTIRGTV
jgi:hypothetical protein